MRKEFPVNIESEEEWIDLPQGTHIHPKEVEKMFDDEEMDEEGREFGAHILPSGKIINENYGTRDNVKLSTLKPEDYKGDIILTHSHPRLLLNENKIVISPALSRTDFGSEAEEVRAFSQDKNKKSGRIHSFKMDINEFPYDDSDDREKMGGYFHNELKEIVNKNYERPKYKAAIKESKGFPIVTHMHTAAGFNLARRGAGDASVIKVRKSEDPKKVYITGIRSTHKDEPQYDLLQTLPRKKKPAKPLMNRLNLTTSIKATGFGLVNLNLNGLSGMLVGSKKKKAVKKKGGKNA